MKEQLTLFREQMKEHVNLTFRSMMEEEYGNQEISMVRADGFQLMEEFCEDVESCVSAFIEDFIWICDTVLYDMRREGAGEAADFVDVHKEELFDRQILRNLFDEIGAKDKADGLSGTKKFEAKAIYMEAVGIYCDILEKRLDEIFS